MSKTLPLGGDGGGALLTMKKKEYIQPEAKEIKLNLAMTILAGSEILDSNETIEEENDIASFEADFYEE